MKNRFKLAESVIIIAALVFAFTALSLTGCPSPTGHKKSGGGNGGGGVPVTGTGEPDTAWYDDAAEGKTEFFISNPDELAGLAVLVNSGTKFTGKTITLTANLDLSVYGVGGDFNSGKGWNHIGLSASSQYFTGTFDGAGKTIIGLSIDNNGEYSALFGYIYSNGVIKNLMLKDVDIKGGDNAGGVAGYSTGRIMNCGVTGTVSGVDKVAGVAGSNGLNGTIINCGFIGTVSGHNNVGGVAGYNNGKLQNCYASGAVSGSGLIGGVAGINSGGTIQNCYFTAGEDGTAGAVSGSDDYIGGVVGQNSNLGTIENCYATGAVSGSSRVGGVAGFNSGSVKNCASLNSSVDGTSDVSRVIGYSFNHNISNNFAFRGMEVKGSTVNGADNDMNGEDMSAAQAKTQSTYSDRSWGFGGTDESPWKMGKTPYTLPVLYWQTSAPGMPGYIKDVTLTLAAGSNGAADFGAITGLTAGSKYIVNEGTNWYPVNSLGQLGASTTDSSAIDNSAVLTETTIKGSGGAYLDNSKTWNVWRVLGSETKSFSCTATARNTYINASMDIDGTVSDGVTITVAIGKTIKVPKSSPVQRALTLNGNAKIVLERNPGISSAYLRLEGGNSSILPESPGKLVFAGAAAAAPECTYKGTNEVRGAPGEAADVVRFPAGSDITGLTTVPQKVKALIGGSHISADSTDHLTIMASNPYAATISRDTLFAIAE